MKASSQKKRYTTFQFTKLEYNVLTYSLKRFGETHQWNTSDNYHL